MKSPAWNDFRMSPWLLRLQLGAMLAFMFLELVVRPPLAGAELPLPLEVLVWSFPNFAEAVVGMAFLGAAAEMLRMRYRPNASTIGPPVVAAVLAAAYVIPREFGVHELGGLNVVDPWDAAASVAGIVLMAVLLMRLEPVRLRSAIRA